MINIAFPAGTHGNFLRYFLDRFSSLTPDIIEEPFTNTGASHKQIKYSSKFQKYHPNNSSPYFKNTNQQHILITIDENDLLFLQRIIHKRIGDYNVNLSQDYIQLPDNYIQGLNISARFFQVYRKKINEFIKVPKFIFRDFFKLHFLNIAHDGYIFEQKKYLRELPKQVLYFPVSAFWNREKFFDEIEILNKKLDLKLVLDKKSEDIFNTFQNDIKELPTKNRCNEIIGCLKDKKDFDLSDVDVIEQAYISAWVEQNYSFITMPNTNYFFKNTKELLNWIEWYPEHYKAMNPNLPSFNGIPNPFYLWNLKK